MALLCQLERVAHVAQVAQGLSATFAPFCGVVLHDLLDPHYPHFPHYPQVIANYANHFADGGQAKSTSIGIKDSTGRYVAAPCVNVDLTLFRSFQNALGQLGPVHTGLTPKESLNPAGTDAVRARIDQFAARTASTPRALRTNEQRALLRERKDSGCTDIRRAMKTVARHFWVSRAAVCSYAK